VLRVDVGVPLGDALPPGTGPVGVYVAFEQAFPPTPNAPDSSTMRGVLGEPAALSY
jgi:hypothetical protein